MFALGRNNPEAAGSRYVQISLLINLHAVECVFALGRGHVEKDFSVRQSAIGVHFVSHDDLLLSVPIVDVEVLLIWREGQTVRSLQIGGQQLEPLAFIAISEDRELPILLHTNHATIPVLVDGEPSLLIERQAV